LVVETPLIAERNAVRCEGKIDFLFQIFVEPECWVYIDIVSPDFSDDFFGNGLKDGGMVHSFGGVKNQWNYN